MLSVLLLDAPRACWSCYGESEVVNSRAVSKPSAVSRDSRLMRHHPDLDPLSPGAVLTRVNKNVVLISTVFSFPFICCISFVAGVRSA